MPRRPFANGGMARFQVRIGHRLIEQRTDTLHRPRRETSFRAAVSPLAEEANERKRARCASRPYGGSWAEQNALAARDQTTASRTGSTRTASSGLPGSEPLKANRTSDLAACTAGSTGARRRLALAAEGRNRGARRPPARPSMLTRGPTSRPLLQTSARRAPRLARSNPLCREQPPGTSAQLQ